MGKLMTLPDLTISKSLVVICPPQTARLNPRWSDPGAADFQA